MPSSWLSFNFTPDASSRRSPGRRRDTADFITIDKDTGHPVIDFRDVTRRQLAAVASGREHEKGVK